VMVGLVTAKALAMAGDKPLIAINHLEGHALSPRLADPGLAFPYLLLLVSGGHCQILLVEGVGRYRRLATTIDDALGEAFDKTAKILGLGFPGGPAVERLAKEGNPKAVPLPRPLLGSAEPHFSFAGLKSAVLRAKQALDGGWASTGSARAGWEGASTSSARAGKGADSIPFQAKPANPNPAQAEPVEAPSARTSTAYTNADIAASFQQAALDCVLDRTRKALAAIDRPSALVVAGGVAANQTVRAGLQALAAQHGVPFVAPPLALCTDNAAMIGALAAAMGEAAPRVTLDMNVDANLKLEPAVHQIPGINR